MRVVLYFRCPSCRQLLPAGDCLSAGDDARLAAERSYLTCPHCGSVLIWSRCSSVACYWHVPGDRREVVVFPHQISEEDLACQRGQISKLRQLRSARS